MRRGMRIYARGLIRFSAGAATAPAVSIHYGLWAMGYACLVREASYPRTRAISMAYGRGLCSRYCLWSIDAPSLCAGAGGGAALGGKVDV